MRAIPEAVALLLKSKSMIGANKSAYEISINEEVISLPVEAISISRNKNMASALTVSIDNKNGVWSPDGVTNPQVLWPNSKVIIKQGYGESLVTTFTGMIDKVDMSTFPQNIKIICRDNLKRALDQTITNTDVGSMHVLTYLNQTVEFIFVDLCRFAGITTGTIGETGITLAEKTFSWESYADCFSWLADISGFEYGADELGAVYFRKDEITAAPTTNYIYKEGEDIISLGYTIDDDNIYYKVAVYGKSSDADEHTVFASADYSSRSYYNVLDQKIMKIDAAEADTVSKCQAIADQAVKLMSSRVRACQFEAVANPYLQVGDYIQVIESSTTISELYRVTDFSTNMTAKGYTMSITCYHHSYTS